MNEAEQDAAVDDAQSIKGNDSPSSDGASAFVSPMPSSVALFQGIWGTQSADPIDVSLSRPAPTTPPRAGKELDEDLQFILACRMVAASTAPPPIPPRHPARPRSGPLGNAAPSTDQVVRQGTLQRHRSANEALLSPGLFVGATPRRTLSTTLPRCAQGPLPQRIGSVTYANEPNSSRRARAVSAPCRDARPIRPLPSRGARTVGRAQASTMAAVTTGQPASAPWTVDEHITLALLQRSERDERLRLSTSTAGVSCSHRSTAQRARSSIPHMWSSTLRAKTAVSPTLGRVSSFVLEETSKEEEAEHVGMPHAAFCGYRVMKFRGCSSSIRPVARKEGRGLTWRAFCSSLQKLNRR